MSSRRRAPSRPRPTLALLVLGAAASCRSLGDAPLAPAAAAESRAGQAQAETAPASPAAEPPASPMAAGSAAAALLTTPQIAWRFQAAASCSGAAAVAPDGATYVATVEGYVHALAPDGTFRWSYNLTGTPLGTPAVDRAGQVYVATSAQRLYALRPDGRVAWMHRPLSRVVTDVVWSSPGTLYFGARDRRLHALAAWGGPLWSRQLLHPLAVAPAILPEGWVAVGTNEPALWLFRGGAMVSRAPLDGALTQPLLAGGEHWFAVAGGELSALPIGDERRSAWRVAARHAAVSGSGEWLVAEARRELAWLAPKTGERSRVIPLPDEPSAPPSVNDQGVAMVPLISGELFIAEPSGSAALVKVAAAPLRAPVWSERTGNAVAVSGSVVLALDLRNWPTPGTPHGPVGMAPEAPGAPDGASGAAAGSSLRRGQPPNEQPQPGKAGGGA